MKKVSELKILIRSLLRNIRDQFIKPVPSAGTQATLSLGCICFAFLLLNQLSLVRSDLSYQKHYDALAKALFAENFTEIASHSVKLIEQVSYYKSNTTGELSISQAEKRRVLEKICRGMEFSASQGIMQGIQEISDIPHTTFLALAKSSKNPIVAHSALKTLQNTFQNYMTRRKKFNTLQKSLPKIRQDLSDRKTNRMKAVQSVLEELTNLLTLPEGNLDQIADGKYFYDSGLLHDLPVIMRIPDNIQNLNDFQIALNNAGGKLKMYGENLDQKFIAKLDEYRKLSTTYRKNLDEIKQEEAVLEQKITVLSRSDEQELKAWKQQMKIFLLELLKQ